jgi:hypothetical protein
LVHLREIIFILDEDYSALSSMRHGSSLIGRHDAAFHDSPHLIKTAHFSPVFSPTDENLQQNN